MSPHRRWRDPECEGDLRQALFLRDHQRNRKLRGRQPEQALKALGRRATRDLRGAVKE
jgi:hypothetical protein